MKFSRIGKAAVSRISVILKEQSRAGGSNDIRLDDRVSIVPTSI
jgi:hypothetical protein